MTAWNDKIGLGRNIAYYRKEARLTQEDLANRVGVHKNYLSDVENGHVKPSLKLVVQIAECFEVKIETILRERRKG